jgi:hypothetical protein
VGWNAHADHAVDLIEVENNRRSQPYLDLFLLPDMQPVLITAHIHHVSVKIMDLSPLPPW